MNPFPSYPLATALFMAHALWSQAHATSGIPHCDINIQPQDNNRFIMEADSIESSSPSEHSLQGNAFVGYREHSLSAQQLSVDTKSRIVSTPGTFQFQSHRSRISGVGATIDFSNRTAQVTEASYTTCIKPPLAWALKAKNIWLDENRNHASANAVQLRLFNVPIAYLPYISFPLGRRKSGFLAPELSSSNKTGIDIGTPYYWNIAPNLDDTITARLLTRRGLMLNNELRYLSATGKGENQLEWMSRDTEKHVQRLHLVHHHRQSVGLNGKWTAHLQHVSDRDFFRDYGDDLAGVSRNALQRYWQYSGFGSRWSASALIHDFQQLDGNSEPYRRLPRIELKVHDSLGPVHGELSGNYQHLQHTSLNTVQIAHAKPATGIHLDSTAAYVHIDGAFDLLFIKTGEQATLTRQIPVFTLDSALYFDRPGDHYQETLKPRLYYIWRPYIEQSTLPLFTSAERESSPDTPFSENRVAGTERFADENRLTFALDYMLDNMSVGHQPLMVRLSQSLLLADQRMELAELVNKKQGDTLSSIEFQWRPAKPWTVYGLTLYDWQNAQPEKHFFRVKYSAGDEELGISYLNHIQSLHVISGTAIQNLGQRWRILGKANYLPTQSVAQELLAGIEFQSCCWRVQLTGKAYRSQPQATMNYKVGLLLELNGLTNFGKDKFNEIKKSSF